MNFYAKTQGIRIAKGSDHCRLVNHCPHNRVVIDKSTGKDRYFIGADVPHFGEIL